MKLRNYIKSLLFKEVKRTHLFEMMEQEGCEIRDKVPGYTSHGFDGGGICSENNGLIRIDNSKKVFSVNRIDEAIRALGSYNMSKITEINNLEDADQYINRKKEIEGITPVKLWTKQREWKEKNTPHVKN